MLTPQREKDLRDAFDKAMKMLRTDAKANIVRVETQYAKVIDSGVVLVIEQDPSDEIMNAVFQVQDEREKAASTSSPTS